MLLSFAKITARKERDDRCTTDSRQQATRALQPQKTTRHIAQCDKPNEPGKEYWAAESQPNLPLAVRAVPWLLPCF